MRMNTYVLGGSSISSNKPVMVFTGANPEFSEKDYSNAAKAKTILTIGPEPINSPLHQN